MSGRLYLAIVTLPPTGELAVAANPGETEDWAGRMVRIINAAELLCSVVADGFDSADERTPDFRTLQRAAADFSAAAKVLHANAMMQAGAMGPGGVA